MAWVERRVARTSQPQDQVGIDQNHPLAQYVTLAWSPKISPFVAHGRGLGTTSSGVAPSISTGLRGVTENKNQNGLEFTSTKPISTQGFTVLYIGNHSSEPWTVCAGSKSGTFRKWAGQYCVIGTNGRRQLSSAALPNNAVVIAGMRDTSNFMFYVNGVNSINQNTLGGETSGVDDKIQLFQSSVGDRSTATYWAAHSSLVVYFDRLLSDDHVKSLSANPWQIFEPEIQYQWVLDEPTPLDCRFIAEPVVRTSQPQDLVPLDPSSSFLSGRPLVVLVGGNPNNLVTGKPLTVIGTDSKTVKSIGLAHANNNTGEIGATIEALGTNDYVDFWFGHAVWDTSKEAFYIIGDYTGSAGTGVFIKHAQATNNVGIFNGVGLQNSGFLSVSGSRYCIVLVKNAGTLSLYIDGVLRTSVSAQSPAQSNWAIGNVGLNQGATFRTPAETFLAGRIGYTSWSPQQVKSFSDNPWQIFETETKYNWYHDVAKISPGKRSMRVNNVRTTQPQDMVGIDWGNPATKGLVRFANAGFAANGFLVDSCNPRITYSSTSPSLTFNGGGKSLANNSTVVWIGSSSEGQGSIGTGDASFVFGGVDGSNNTSQYFCQLGTQTSAAGNVYVGDRSGNVSALNVFGGVLSVAPIANHIPFRLETTVIVRRSGVCHFWMNGAYLGAANNTSSFGDFPFSLGSVSGNQRSVNFGGLYTLALSDSVAKSLSDNPWQIFEPETHSIWYAELTLPRIVYPNTDVATGGWVSSTGGALYSTLDEAVPEDADYISVNSVSSCTMRLEATAYPGMANQSLSYRASSTQGSFLTIRLSQRNTVIMTRTHQLTGLNTLYTQTLTPEEIALIGDGAIDVTISTS